MIRPSKPRLAQVCIGILLLVIVRSLGEYFRVQYLHGDAVAIVQINPYIAGALFATVALALTVLCYFASLFRTSIAVTAATLILLFAYKVVIVG